MQDDGRIVSMLAQNSLRSLLAGRKCDPNQQIGSWDGRIKLVENLGEDKMTANELQPPARVVGKRSYGKCGLNEIK